VYIGWLCSAVFLHLPSFQALGIDVRTDLSMLLTIFLLSLLARALATTVVMHASWWIGVWGCRGDPVGARACAAPPQTGGCLLSSAASRGGARIKRTVFAWPSSSNAERRLQADLWAPGGTLYLTAVPLTPRASPAHNNRPTPAPRALGACASAKAAGVCAAAPSVLQAGKLVRRPLVSRFPTILSTAQVLGALHACHLLAVGMGAVLPGARGGAAGRREALACILLNSMSLSVACRRAPPRPAGTAAPCRPQHG